MSCYFSKLEKLWHLNDYPFFAKKKCTSMGRMICVLTIKCYFKAGKHESYTYRADDLIDKEFKGTGITSYLTAIQKKIKITLPFCHKIDVYLNCLPDGRQKIQTWVSSNNNTPEVDNLKACQDWIRRKLPNL